MILRFSLGLDTHTWNSEIGIKKLLEIEFNVNLCVALAKKKKKINS